MYKRQTKQSQTESYIDIGSYRYKESDMLGQGYESVVYRAIHSETKFEVALKIIDLCKIEPGITRDLLDSELNCLEILKGSPFIINLLEVVKTEKQIYVVTDLCNSDLSKREKKVLPEHEAWSFIKQMIAGYKSLHQNKLIHRDLKPENLFLVNKHQIKIGDFGFAAPLSLAKDQNLYSIGSPSYMAPEVLKRNEYSFASDIWSMGVSFYELITGDLPWNGETEEELASQISPLNIKKTIECLKISEESKHFLRKTLCYDPYERIRPEELFSFELTWPLESKMVGEKAEYDSTSTAHTPYTSYDKFKDCESIKSIDSKSEIDNLMDGNEKRSVFFENNKRIPQDRQSRRMSFDGNLLASHKMKREEFLKQVTKSEDILGEVVFKKNHRTSFDSIHNEGLRKSMDKFSERFIDNCINKHLKLNDLIFNFIQSSSSFDFENKWKTKLNLFKVCMKNHLSTIMKKIECLDFSNVVIGLSSEEMKRYAESKYFKQTQVLLKSKINEYLSNEEIRVHWNIAREQKIKGIKNAGFLFLSSLRENMKEQESREFVQSCSLMCQILEIVSRMEKNNNELKEDIDTKFKHMCHSNLLSRFEEIEKLK